MIKIKAQKEVIQNLPPQVFSNLGVDQIAYVRPVEENEHQFFAVHAANGQEMMVFDNPIEATDFIRMNNLYPITVH